MTKNWQESEVDIGQLIVASPEIRGNRARIAGTGVTVQRVVGWYKLGLTPEEIGDRVGHLNLAQVHAALAYYHANREQVEAQLAAEEAEDDQAEQGFLARAGSLMFRLYVDEDSGDRNLVQALRARGVDVITAQEAGMIERTDDEHLQFATGRGRVLYSFNRGDFLRLHSQYLAEGKDHAGMLLARQQHYSVGEQMRRVLKVMALKSAADMRN